MPVACPVPHRAPESPRLSGGLAVSLVPSSLARALYGRDAIEEEYFCSYEVNPAFEETIASSSLRITGRGESGEIRVVELPAHRFFLATLFQPQRSSRPGAPNPVVAGFVNAARAFRDARGARGT